MVSSCLCGLPWWNSMSIGCWSVDKNVKTWHFKWKLPQGGLREFLTDSGLGCSLEFTHNSSCLSVPCVGFNWELEFSNAEGRLLKKTLKSWRSWDDREGWVTPKCRKMQWGPFNPFTPKNNQFQIPPSASPEILFLYTTQLKNLAFHSLLRWKIPNLTTSYTCIHYFSLGKGCKNILFWISEWNG